MKTLLQLLCSARWDDSLTVDVKENWIRLLSELPMLGTVSIPRNILDSSWLKIQLVGFSDVSLLGMAAVLCLGAESNHALSCHLTQVSRL